MGCIPALDGKGAQLTKGVHLPVLCRHGGQVEGGGSDGDVAWELHDSASQFVPESRPGLSKKINAPNVDMSHLEERDQSETFVEERVGATVGRDAPNVDMSHLEERDQSETFVEERVGATVGRDAAFVGLEAQKADALHSELEMVRGAEIVMPDTV